MYFWQTWDGVKARIHSSPFSLSPLEWSNVIQLKLGIFFLPLWEMKKNLGSSSLAYDSLRAGSATNYEVSL